jgi:hypothetical protein
LFNAIAHVKESFNGSVSNAAAPLTDFPKKKGKREFIVRRLKDNRQNSAETLSTIMSTEFPVDSRHNSASDNHAADDTFLKPELPLTPNPFSKPREAVMLNTTSPLMNKDLRLAMATMSQMENRRLNMMAPEPSRASSVWSSSTWMSNDSEISPTSPVNGTNKQFLTRRCTNESQTSSFDEVLDIKPKSGKPLAARRGSRAKDRKAV